MKSPITRILTAVCSAAVLIFTASCGNPAGPAKAADPKPAGSTDTSKIGFEGTLVPADYSADEGGVAGGLMNMAFTADTVLFNTGAQSLKVTGTSRINAWSTDYFGELKIALGTPVDFTGKTVAVSVYVPTGSTVAAVNLTLINADGKQKLIHEQGVTAGQWNSLSFANTPLDYDEAGSSFTGIQTLRLRFETRTGGTAASGAISVNVDSINW